MIKLNGKKKSDKLVTKGTEVRCVKIRPILFISKSSFLYLGYITDKYSQVPQLYDQSCC